MGDPRAQQTVAIPSAFCEGGLRNNKPSNLRTANRNREHYRQPQQQQRFRVAGRSKPKPSALRAGGACGARPGVVMWSEWMPRISCPT